MNSISLDQLLTMDQLRKVMAIYDKHGNSPEGARALKTYLNTFKAELEAKGVLPDYAAYLLLFTLDNHGEEIRAVLGTGGNPANN